MPDSTEDTSRSSPVVPEDVIGSPPSRLGALLARLDSRLPQSFGRAAMLAVAVVAALVGLVIGHVTAPAEPEGDTAAPVSTDQAGEAGHSTELLTLQELAAIGEPASGGTYTVGSASALPDLCSRPAPGDPGVRYVADPLEATAVSFQLVGGSVTERVTALLDEVVARAEMRAQVSRVRNCPAERNVNVALATIGPGVGDEYVQAMVTHSYPSGSSTTVSILLIRVGAVLVEFSLAGPSTAAAESSARCLAIARVGLRH